MLALFRVKKQILFLTFWQKDQIGFIRRQNTSTRVLGPLREFIIFFGAIGNSQGHRPAPAKQIEAADYQMGDRRFWC